MTEQDNGRFCKSCNKLVIDFTVLSDDEIKAFLTTTQTGCGRFYKKQLERIRIHIPSHVLHKRIPLWKKFLIIFLVCFGSNLFSFDTMVGSQPGLYAQTTSSNAMQKKQKVKSGSKKKRLRIVKELDYKILDYKMIAGGFGPMPIHPPEFPPIAIFPIGIGSPVIHSNTVSITAAPRDQRTPNNQKQKNNNAYILPTSSKYRRRKSRVKKKVN